MINDNDDYWKEIQDSGKHICEFITLETQLRILYRFYIII